MSILRIGLNKSEEEEILFSFDSLSNIRLPIEYHGRFKKVIFTEKPISSYLNWPLILDEVIRSGCGDCSFSFLITTGEHYFSIASFYKQIYLISKGNIKLNHIRSINNLGGYEIDFSVRKTLPQHKNTWSFGVVWDGSNLEYLSDFIYSVTLQKSIYLEFEIIICGPKFDTSKFKTDIIFVSVSESDEKMSNISVKKNKIVKSARYENICIVHNRYKLPSNFIDSFLTFGLDFELCVVPQMLNSNKIRVPDWVSQSSDFRLTKNYWLEYGSYSPYQYSPGGMIIAKRDILLETPWNELITWNMAEDVELSQRLRNKGYVYKLNDQTKALVLSLREDIIKDFNYIDVEVLLNSSDNVRRESCPFKSIFINIKSFIYNKLIAIFKR